MKKLFLTLGLSLFTLLGFSANRTWTGSINSDWANSGNWSGGNIPGSNDLAIIPNLSNGNYPIISTVVTLKNLQVSDWNGGNLTVATGGELTVTATVDLNNNGTLTIDGGVFNHSGTTFNFAYTNALVSVLGGSFTTNEDFSVNGEFHVEAGTVIFADGLTLSTSKNFYGGSGNITVFGGVSINGNFYAEQATINFHKKKNGDKVFITSGGEVTVTTGSIVFHDNTDIKSNGTLNVGDGSVSFAKDAKFESSSTLTVHDGDLYFLGDADFQSSASLTITGDGSVSISGTSTLQSSGYINVGSGSFSIDGEVNISNSGAITATTGDLTLNGNLTLQNNDASVSLGSSTMNFNGGTLTNNGTFNSDSSTVVLNSSNNQTISGDIEFYNLDIETNAEVTLNGEIVVTNNAVIDSTSQVVIPGTNSINVQGEFNDYSGTALVSATRPFIKYLTTTSLTTVKLEFNEPLDPTTAQNTANYVLTPSQTISSAVLGPSHIVTLTFSPGMTNQTNQVLVMNNIKNLSGKVISTDHTKKFVANVVIGPSVPSSNFTFTNTATKINAGFTKGGGNSRIVLISTSPAFTNLIDKTTYSVNNDLSSATPLSGTTYAVAKGDIDSMNIIGLEQNTRYFGKIIEFNGTDGNQAYGAHYNFSFFTDLNLNLTLFLEGPYNSTTGAMNTDLADKGLIPLNQPFNDSIWNYDGSESLASVPANMVDWVLVELRQSTTPVSAKIDSVIFRKACILLSDGSVVQTNGDVIQCELQEASTFYVSVIHPTHSISLSSQSITRWSNGNYGYDFNQAQGAYGPTDFLIQEGNKYLIPVMKIVERTDTTGNSLSLFVKVWNNRGSNGYNDYDVNRDGIVSAADRVLIYNNKEKTKAVDTE